MAENQGILVNLKGENPISSFKPSKYEWLGPNPEQRNALRLWLNDGTQVTIRPGQYALVIVEPVTKDP